MTKVQIKNERISPFAGIYYVTRQFKPVEAPLTHILDSAYVELFAEYG